MISAWLISFMNDQREIASWNTLNPLTAGHDYIRGFSIFYYHIKKQL